MVRKCQVREGIYLSYTDWRCSDLVMCCAMLGCTTKLFSCFLS
jgi:hypothetical protein